MFLLHLKIHYQQETIKFNVYTRNNYTRLQYFSQFNDDSNNIK